MSENVVAKYGGTSMAQPEVVASVVESYPQQKIIVVSAPGKLGDTYDTKVTDLLINMGESLKESKGESADQIEEIADRFTSAYGSISDKDLRKLEDELSGDLKEYSQNWRFPDMGGIVSVGEEYSAKYFAKLVGGRFVAPEFFRFKEPTIDFYRDKSYKLINKQRDKLLGDSPAIVPGFYGYHEVGNGRVLFDRGGSDISAVILSGVLGLDHHNFTDQDGIRSGDPRVVDFRDKDGNFVEPRNTRVVPVLSRDEVREGAHGGNPVLQGDSILYLSGTDVVVNIRNTFNPAEGGTLIVPKRDTGNATVGNSVVAVTGRNDVSQINIRDLGMADKVGYVESITNKLKSMGVSLQHMPTSQDSLSLVVHNDIESDIANIEELKEFVESHSASMNPEITIEEKGIIYVVGEALRKSHFRHQETSRVMGIASIGRKALLPISAVNSPSIAFLTERSDTDELVQKIHFSEIEKDER